MFSKRLTLILAQLILFGFVYGQDEKPPFSERTGIKGVTLFFGGQRPINDNLYGAELFNNASISPKMVEHYNRDLYDTSNKLDNWNRRRIVLPSVRTELVLAPFRLNSKEWMRNIEWTHGVMWQYRNGKVDIKGTKYLNDDQYETFDRQYSFSISQLSYQTNVLFNFPVAGNTMLYTGVGAGAGMPLLSHVRSSPAKIREFKRTNGHFEQVNEYNRYQQETYANTSWNNLLYATVGAKIHLSCRINIHGEYGFTKTHHYLTNGTKLHDFRHGLMLGVRYKFNRPPAEEGDPEKEAKPFW